MLGLEILAADQLVLGRLHQDAQGYGRVVAEGLPAGEQRCRVGVRQHRDIGLAGGDEAGNARDVRRACHARIAVRQHYRAGARLSAHPARRSPDRRGVVKMSRWAWRYSFHWRYGVCPASRSEAALLARRARKGRRFIAAGRDVKRVKDTADRSCALGEARGPSNRAACTARRSSRGQAGRAPDLVSTATAAADRQAGGRPQEKGRVPPPFLQPPPGRPYFWNTSSGQMVDTA